MLAIYSADDILNAVCEVTDIPIETMRVDARSVRIVYPRFLAYFLLAFRTGMNQKQIAYFMQRDRSGISHGIRRALTLLDDNEQVKAWHDAVVLKLEERAAA